MFCIECGKGVNSIAKFCNHCGANQIFEKNDLINSDLLGQVDNVSANQSKSTFNNGVGYSFGYWFGTKNTKDRILFVVYLFIGIFLLIRFFSNETSTPLNFNKENKVNSELPISTAASKQMDNNALQKEPIAINADIMDSDNGSIFYKSNSKICHMVNGMSGPYAEGIAKRFNISVKSVSLLRVTTGADGTTCSAVIDTPNGITTCAIGSILNPSTNKSKYLLTPYIKFENGNSYDESGNCYP